MPPPDRVQRAYDGASLGEVHVLELAVPQTYIHRLLPEVLQGDLRLGPDVFQFDLSCHVHSQGINKHTQHVAQDLRWEPYHLQIIASIVNLEIIVKTS